MPTPQASDANMRQGIDTASHARNVQRGQLASVALESTRMWPTPISREKDGSAPRYRDGVLQLDTLGRAVGGSLNPTFVEWLMGFPPRLDGGLNGRDGVDTVGKCGWKTRKQLAKSVVETLVSGFTTRIAIGRRTTPARELADSFVRLATRLLALAGGQSPLAAASCFLHRVRQACEAVGAVRETHRSRLLRHGSPYLTKKQKGRSWLLVDERIVAKRGSGSA